MMRLTITTILLAIALDASHAGFSSSDFHDLGGTGLSGGGHDFSGGGHDFGGGDYGGHSFSSPVQHYYDYIPTKKFEQTKPIHINVVKKVAVPEPHPVGVPVPQVIKVPVPQPRLRKRCLLPWKSWVPVYVKKPYKVIIEKHHPVYVNKPYPVHVPVYKHVLHKSGKH
ncbi:hypothetical protein NQ317_011839 [Molorchus minor]|uniref:Uncharacterized protein n=1 Tax=Molorchus minor TaxID=1323400 RepID=A0ABQ9JQU1_9CUCU|nr:hypothetical protein NQ317_011839 [Molorchus minor]